MKIGLIADIHGNLPALESVFKSNENVDAWLCAGDIVGYYPDVNEVCALLRNRNVIAVRGNHDAYVCGALQPDVNKQEVYKTAWTRSHMSKANLKWLTSLPIECIFSWDNILVRVRHASPWDETTYLYPDSYLLSNVELEENTFLVLGHSHHPMIRKIKYGVVVNPGSVGQPRDYNPGPAFAMIDTETQAVILKRAVYDVDGYQDRLRNMAWDEAVTAMLKRTR